LRIALRALLLGLVSAGPTAWACLALWLDGPASRPLAGSLAAGFALATVGVLALVRPLSRAAALWVAGFAAVLLWWLSLAPSNDRAWQPDVEHPPTAEVRGDRLTLRNVRNFEYRSETDFTPHWEERTYDLARLVGLDLFLSFWGPTQIAHTIMSWEFSDGQHLAASIETRKEQGESYSALRGFFRQFELYYVMADERDLVGLRTNHRGETVYVYRLPAPPEHARALLMRYVETADALAREARWYNALTHNCTTSIRLHGLEAGSNLPLDWRLLLNGHLDEYLYDLGRLNRDLPLRELRLRSDVTARARAAGTSPDFSQRIRDGLPARPKLPPDLTAREIGGGQGMMRPRSAVPEEGS
jgi:hypothetical protein